MVRWYTDVTSVHIYHSLWGSQCSRNSKMTSRSAHIAKSLGSMSIRYWSDGKVSDRCLIDVDPMVFAIRRVSRDIQRVGFSVWREEYIHYKRTVFTVPQPGPRILSKSEACPCTSIRPSFNYVNAPQLTTFQYLFHYYLTHVTWLVQSSLGHDWALAFRLGQEFEPHSGHWLSDKPSSIPQ